MNRKFFGGFCAAALCVCLIMAGCGKREAPSLSKSEIGSQEASSAKRKRRFERRKLLFGEIVIAPAGENKINLGKRGTSVSENVITATVTGKSVNSVKAGIFGANVSWRGDGYGQWNAQADAPDQKLMEKLKASGVTHMRYPGGIEGDYFHWNECIGSNRKPQIDCFSTEYPAYEAYDGVKFPVAFGPDEFLRLCREAGDGVTMQLNTGNGTPKEGADWVRYYMEKGADIRSVCVGNEGCMAVERVDGVKVTCTPQEYVDFYNSVYRELGDTAKKVELGCIGITPSHPLCKYRNWDSTVLTQLADKIDFIDVHIGYAPYFINGQPQKDIVKCFLGSSQWVKNALDEEISIINSCAGGHAKDISVQITEWGPIGSHSTSVAGSLYMASFFNTVLAEPKVSSACYLPLINHYNAANILGALTDTSVTGEKVYWDNCNSHVFRWYSQQTGRDVLSTKTEGGKKFDTVKVGLVPAQKGVSEGEVSVYYDKENGKGSIFVLNKSYDENTKFDVILPFEDLTVEKITEMWDENYFAFNGYANPDKVKPVTYKGGMKAKDGHLLVEAKPVSLLKIDFTAK